MFGIYIHVPFCSSFCLYCDFYSVIDSSKRDKYIEALNVEIERRAKELVGFPRTIYIGGGTPSLLSPSQLNQIFDSLKTHFSFAEVEEITIEVNPDDITKDYAMALRSAGINRVSMGVQSFDDAHLRWMRRRHSAEQAINSYNILKECGFNNISIDLIFGYSLHGEDEDELFSKWNKDIDTLLKLRPEHVSAYQMSIEPGSLLAKSKSYKEPYSELCEKEYFHLINLLKEGGYHQYEISNFALPNYESKHNSSYWDRTPYLGFGPSAHSFNGVIRSWNPDSIAGYCRNVGRGWGDTFLERLSPEEAFEEKLMLGLRKTEGVELSKEEAFSIQDRVVPLVKKGLLISEKMGTHLKIPTKYLFISDSIISELFP